MGPASDAVVGAGISADRGKAITVRLSGDAEDSEWDDFLAATPGTHHEQTSLWAQVRLADGWKAIRLRLERDGAIAGGAQMLWHKAPLMGNVGYVPMGPVLVRDAPALRNAAVRAILKEARLRGISYLVVEPPYNGHGMVQHLKTAGFRPKPEGWPPVTLMAATLMIDVSCDPETILARMRKTTRGHIRQSWRREVRIREGETEEDVGTFFELMLATCRRRGEAPYPADREFLLRLWRLFRPRGWILIRIAECQGEAVCAEIELPFSDTVRHWKFGWNGLHDESRPTEALIWSSVNWARNKGYRYVDMVQVDPEIAETLSGHAPLPDALRQRRLFGSTMFKMGFGGDVVRLPGAHYLFMNPLLRVGDAALGGIMRSPRVMKAFGRAWSWTVRRGRGRSC